MLVTIGECASEANTLPASQADMRGLIEVEWTLSGLMPDGLLFGLAWGDQTGGREPLGLGCRFLRRAV